MVFFLFNKNKNYIGNKEWMYKYTNRIKDLFPEINFTAYKHDIHYSLLLAEKNHLIRLILKIWYDLIFLVVGLVRLIFHPKQLTGISVLIFLYLILFFHTPFYLIENRKNKIDLTYIKSHVYKINKK